MDAIMDFMTPNSAQGEVAGSFVGNALNINTMKPYIGSDGRSYITVCNGNPKDPQSYAAHPINVNATLRKEEWQLFDQVLVQVARDRLTGVNDLISRGLTYQLGNAMGTTVLQWEEISDAFEAELTMDAISRGKNDRVDFASRYLPIPIIHMDFQINRRTLESSRRLGNPLDTTNLELAARKCAEKLEEMLFTDTKYAYGGGNIYSYVNFPDRKTYTLAKSWVGASGATADEIIADVLAMKQASIDNFHYGPWVIYIPTAYETKLDEDYDKTAPSGTTIRERIMKISGISNIKTIDRLKGDNILFLEMRSETVRLIQGMGLQVVQWQTEGNMINKYKVMTIQVPQIRSDYYGRCGIVHAAKA